MPWRPHGTPGTPTDDRPGCAKVCDMCYQTKNDTLSHIKNLKLQFFECSPQDFHTRTLNFRKVRRAYQNRWDSRCQLLLCCVNPGNRKGRVSKNYVIILSFSAKSVKLDKANFSSLELILNGFVAFCILNYLKKKLKIL